LKLFNQWFSKGMANCAYARGGNSKGAQNCASKVLYYLFYLKNEIFPLYFLKCV